MSLINLIIMHMDTRVALLTRIGNADIVDLIMTWVRHLANMAHQARRRTFGSWVRASDLRRNRWLGTRFPLSFERADGEGGFSQIPFHHPLWNELNGEVGIRFPIQMTPRFPEWWQFDHWGINRDESEDGRGGFPASRIWRTGMHGVFRAIENPRLFLPGL